MAIYLRELEYRQTGIDATNTFQTILETGEINHGKKLVFFFALLASFYHKCTKFF